MGESIVRMEYIETLDLSYNKIKSLPTTLLFKFDELRTLNLAGNNLKDFLQGIKFF